MPLAFSPFGHWPVAPASVALLGFLLRGRRPAAALKLAWWFGVGLYGAGTSWIYISIHIYGAASPPLAALLTGLFCAGMALLFALPFALSWLVNLRHPSGMLLGLPALWVLGEWLRSWFLTGFPWLFLGYSAIDTPLAGLAPVTGVLGLSLAVAFSGALLAICAARANWRILGAAVVLLGALWSAAGWLQQKTWTQPAGKPLDVALVQPAQGLTLKWNPHELPAILANFTETNRELSDADLIIWPETAIPRFQHQVAELLQSEHHWARSHDTGLILGIPIADSTNHRYYNGLIGLGSAEGSYRKRRLVPFGEYVPLESLLRGTIAFFDLPMSDFSRAAEYQPPLRLSATQLAAAICYEIVYPDLVATSVAETQLLVTVSNDTWFGASIGPHQHFQMARMRALETGKPLLRATNDGITAVADSRGQIIDQLPQFEPGVLRTRVTPHSGTTPFSRYRSTPVVILGATLLIAAAVTRRHLGATA